MTTSRMCGRLNETRNYVIDLETLGLGPDAIVVSAALAQFDSKSTRLIATWTIDTEAQEAAGRVMDADTVMWWLKQSDAARGSITSKEAQRRKVSPLVFLKDLFAIMREDRSARPLGAPAHPTPDSNPSLGWSTGGGDDNFTLWAKPQHFDIGILEHMARQFDAPKREVCLHRRRVHNVRTALAMVNLVRAGIDWPEELDETPNPGAHDAAADAMVTAAVMRDALKEIEGFTGLLNVVQASMEKHAALPPVVSQVTTPRVLQSADEAPCGSLINPTDNMPLTVRLPSGRGYHLAQVNNRGMENRPGWQWHEHGVGGPVTLIAEGLTEPECRHLSGISAAEAIAWCEARDKAAKPRPQPGDVVPWTEVEVGCLYYRSDDRFHPFRMVVSGLRGLIMGGPEDGDIHLLLGAPDRGADVSGIVWFERGNPAGVLVARDLGTDPEAWRKAMREWTARASEAAK